MKSSIPQRQGIPPCSAGKLNPRASERRKSSTSRDSDSINIQDSSRMSKSVCKREVRKEESCAKNEPGGGVENGGIYARRGIIMRGRISGPKIWRAVR